MAKPTTEAPEEFFRILEQLDSIPATAAEEIEDRLNLARIVPTAVERQAVRMTTGLIAAEMAKIDNGADPGGLAAKLVGIVSEKNGPTPFLARIQAVVALGQMRAKTNLLLNRQAFWVKNWLRVWLRNRPLAALLFYKVV